VKLRSGKMGRGSHRADPGTNANHGFCFHDLPCRCEATG
jgi:hypothetical protein